MGEPEDGINVIKRTWNAWSPWGICACGTCCSGNDYTGYRFRNYSPQYNLCAPFLIIFTKNSLFSVQPERKVSKEEMVSILSRFEEEFPQNPQ